MKSMQSVAEEKLAHALTFLHLAMASEFPELRLQHLKEAERLIEFARGVIKEKNGSQTEA